jgi:uncharacterized OB-fold protein
VGKIYSFTIVPQPDGIETRIVVLVALSEGVRVLGNLIQTARPAIGLRVRVASSGAARGPITFVSQEDR